MPNPRHRPLAPLPDHHPSVENPALSAQLDTAFPMSERDFLAMYEPWVPKDRRGGDRRVERHDGWTVEAQQLFLLALRYRRSVTRAAACAGLSRENAYQLRRRWPPFAQAWDLARRRQACTVADLLLRQVLEGVDEPIVRRGVVVGHRRVNRMATALWVFRQLKVLDDGIPRRVRRVRAPAGWDESGLVAALLRPGKSRG
jgi:hypothetical protein